MSRIFLSHSSKDDLPAVALRDWLASEGWNDVFLDFDPDRGIVAGQRWERRLHEAASRCEAVVFLVSEHWLASGWCMKEYTTALRLNKKLFAVLIDPSKTLADLPPELTDTWQVTDLAGGKDMVVFRAVRPGTQAEAQISLNRDGLTRLKRGLQKAGLDARFFAWPPEGEPTRSPYRGLKPLEAADAGIFFGRDAPIVEATDRLRGLRTGAPPRLMVILGASGAGKSSFLRAGLLPRLARDDTHFVVLRPIRPERAAITGENGLLRALEAACPGSPAADIEAAVASGAAALRPLLTDLVESAFRRTLAEAGSATLPTIVIAIDQAEELFRADGVAESQRLLDLVRELTVSDDPVAVITIFAIRSDSYDALEHARGLEGLRQDTIPLLPMPRGAYKDVIEGPALRLNEAGGKLVIEPQLTERMLEDIQSGAGSDALPLLAFMLEQLDLAFHQTGIFRLQDYTALGGLGGVIDAAVERAFARADADKRIPRERSAREALLRRGLIPWLAGVDPDTKSPRRNIARLADIPAEAAPLVDLLVEERLLSTDIKRTRDPQSGDQTLTKTIEPTHEALLRQWGLLDGWLAEDFGLLATLESVQRSSRDWDANARQAAWLTHGGSRLAEAQGLDGRPDIAVKLDATDRTYMAACREREDAIQTELEQHRHEREAEQERRIVDAQALTAATRRTAQRTRIGLVVALVLAAAATGFGLFAKSQKTLADQKTVEANISSRTAVTNQSSALAALSSTILPQDPAAAAKFALAAWPRDLKSQDAQIPKAVGALSDAVVMLRERIVFQANSTGMYGVNYSDDGNKIVAFAKYENIAKVFDLFYKKEEFSIKADAVIGSAFFSRDGFSVIAETGGELDLYGVGTWNASSGAPVFKDTNITGKLSCAHSCSTYTQLIATAEGANVSIFDLTSGKKIKTIQSKCEIEKAKLSRDLEFVATVCQDSSVDIWRIEDSRKISTIITAAKNGIDLIDFSPNSKEILFVFSRTAQTFTVAHGKPIARLQSEPVSHAAYSPSGNLILTTAGNVASIWDADAGNVICHLKGHDARVLATKFSQTGGQVVSASEDHTARTWDTRTCRQLSVMRGHRDSVTDASFSPDGLHVATASKDGTVRVWDTVRVDKINLDTNAGETLSEPSHGDASIPGSKIPSRRGVYLASHVYKGASGIGVRIFDSRTGKATAMLSANNDLLLLSNDGRRALVSGYTNLQLIDTLADRVISDLAGTTERRGSSFSEDDNRLMLWDQTTVRIWDAHSGRDLATLKSGNDPIQFAEFSSDGRKIIVTGSRVEVWDIGTQKLDFTFVCQLSTTRGAFSPDGRLVAAISAAGGQLCIRDAAGVILRQAIRFRQSAEKLVFSGDGSKIAAIAGTVGTVWETTTIGELVSLDSGREDDGLSTTGFFDDISFTSDGSRIITSSLDAGVVLWDVFSGMKIFSLSDQWPILEAKPAVLNGHVYLISAEDLYDWDLSGVPKGNLFQIACSWLPDHNIENIANSYQLSGLLPICTGNPPQPRTGPAANAPSSN